MARLTFSPNAQEQLAELPRDKVLLKAIWQHLERAADDPEGFTSDPPLLMRQDRRMASFRAYDTTGRQWAVVAMFAPSDDVMQVTSINFNPNAGDYPADD